MWRQTAIFSAPQAHICNFMLFTPSRFFVFPPPLLPALWSFWVFFQVREVVFWEVWDFFVCVCVCVHLRACALFCPWIYKRVPSISSVHRHAEVSVEDRSLSLCASLNCRLVFPIFLPKGKQEHISHICGRSSLLVFPLPFYTCNLHCTSPFHLFTYQKQNRFIMYLCGRITWNISPSVCTMCIGLNVFFFFFQHTSAWSKEITWLVPAWLCVSQLLHRVKKVMSERFSPAGWTASRADTKLCQFWRSFPTFCSILKEQHKWTLCQMSVKPRKKKTKCVRLNPQVYHMLNESGATCAVTGQAGQVKTRHGSFGRGTLILHVHQGTMMGNK